MVLVMVLAFSMLCSAAFADEGAACTDSDGGRGYGVRGTANSTNGNHTDLCKPDQVTLGEYYCGPYDLVEYEEHACPYGCAEGACNLTCAEGSTEACNGSRVGICSPGIRTCANGQMGSCEGAVAPKMEICSNGVDDDCNGAVDDCMTIVCCLLKASDRTDAGFPEYNGAAPGADYTRSCAYNYPYPVTDNDMNSFRSVCTAEAFGQLVYQYCGPSAKPYARQIVIYPFPPGAVNKSLCTEDGCPSHYCANTTSQQGDGPVPKPPTPIQNTTPAGQSCGATYEGGYCPPANTPGINTGTTPGQTSGSTGSPGSADDVNAPVQPPPRTCPGGSALQSRTDADGNIVSFCLPGSPAVLADTNSPTGPTSGSGNGSVIDMIIKWFMDIFGMK